MVVTQTKVGSERSGRVSDSRARGKRVLETQTSETNLEFQNVKFTNSEYVQTNFPESEKHIRTQRRPLSNGDGSRENKHLNMDIVHGFIDESSTAHGSERHRKF